MTDLHDLLVLLGQEDEERRAPRPPSRDDLDQYDLFQPDIEDKNRTLLNDWAEKVSNWFDNELVDRLSSISFDSAVAPSADIIEDEMQMSTDGTTAQEWGWGGRGSRDWAAYIEQVGWATIVTEFWKEKEDYESWGRYAEKVEDEPNAEELILADVRNSLAAIASASIFEPVLAQYQQEIANSDVLWDMDRLVVLLTGFTLDPGSLDLSDHIDEWYYQKVEDDSDYQDFVYKEHEDSLREYAENSWYENFRDRIISDIEHRCASDWKEARNITDALFDGRFDKLYEKANGPKRVLKILSVASEHIEDGDKLDQIVLDLLKEYEKLRTQHPEVLPDLAEAYPLAQVSTSNKVQYQPGAEYIEYLKKTIQKSGPIQWNTFIKSNPWVKEEPFYRALPDPKTGGRYITEESLAAIENGDGAVYGISEGSWSSDLQNTFRNKQLVIRLDVTDETLSGVDPWDQKSVLTFLKGIARSFSGHPIGPYTIGYARIADTPDGNWLVDEVQSDALAVIENKPNGREFADSVGPQVIDQIFGDWEYALMQVVMKRARDAGIKKVYMATPEILSHKGASPMQSKIKRYYKKLPRELGFVLDREGLEVPTRGWPGVDTTLPVWVREAHVRLAHFIRASVHRLIAQSSEVCNA